MKKMNYLLLTLSLSLTVFTLSAQSLERFAIGSAGLSTQNENLQISFTVGETMVSSFQTDDFQLTQGFQQTVIEEMPTGIELPANIHEIIAYPNPAKTTLYVEVNATKAFDFSLEVYDISGKLQVLPSPLLGIAGYSQHQIDLTGLVPGIYLLLLKTPDGVPVKIFKIQKR